VNTKGLIHVEGRVSQIRIKMLGDKSSSLFFNNCISLQREPLQL
jgi:hypothetical protein